MKKKLLFGLMLTLLCGVTACNSTPSTGSNSSSPNSTVTSPIKKINTIREAEVGTEFEVIGTVVKHVYAGQTTPYITGFLMADETGCINIYGEDVAKEVEVGNKVYIRGKKTYYIPNTDTGSAAAVGYKGAQQLEEPALLLNYGGTHAIPNIVTPIAHLKEVMSTPLTTDISNNLYRTNGRIVIDRQDGFTNYYLEDTNRVDSINFYTQSNGKDFAWLNENENKIVDMTFAILNAKPGTGLWRGLPIEVHGLVTLTDQEEANYAADRAASQFSEKYLGGASFKVANTDQMIKDIQFTYATKDTDLVTITKNATDTSIVIQNPTTEKTITIDVTASYKTVKSTKTLTITLGPKPVIATVDISEAMKKENGTEVTIEGVVARRTWKSGSNASPLGCFVADETGAIVVYNDATFMTNLDNVKEGNNVILKGTIDRFISNAEYATTHKYTGDLQLKNVTVLFNDGSTNELPTNIIKDAKVSDILGVKPETNLCGKIYKMTVKVVTGGYGATSLVDPNDASLTLSVYSQQSGKDFEWLTTLDDVVAGKTITLIVGVQNLKYGASSYNWRMCPIAVVS